jgi:hypothetical protein
MQKPFRSLWICQSLARPERVKSSGLRAKGIQKIAFFFLLKGYSYNFVKVLNEEDEEDFWITSGFDGPGAVCI